MALSVSVLTSFYCKTEKIWYFGRFSESVKAINPTSQGHPMDLYFKISVLFGQIFAGWEILEISYVLGGKVLLENRKFMLSDAIWCVYNS